MYRSSSIERSPMNYHSDTSAPYNGASPMVSVVIPARNAAATLAETLRSLQQQDFDAWEAVVVDDGSTDDTAAITHQFSVNDGRIRCIPGPKRGVSAARNAGIHRSVGAFVAFLDADDLWLPHKLRTHMDYMTQHPQVGITFDRVLFVNVHGHSTGVFSTQRVSNLPPHAFIYENPACTASTLVVRRTALVQCGAFDELMKWSEDLEFMVRMRCTTAWGVQGLDDVMTYYRASPTGASASLESMQAGWEHLIIRVKSYAPELVAKHYRPARAVHLRYLARRALRVGAPASLGLRLFGQALASSPLALMREPRRTLGTLGGLCAQGVIEHLPRTQRN